MAVNNGLQCVNIIVGVKQIHGALVSWCVAEIVR